MSNHQAITDITIDNIGNDNPYWDIQVTMYASELIAFIKTASNVAQREGLVHFASRTMNDAQSLQSLLNTNDDHTVTITLK